jgi:hypothetical protein
MRFGRIILAVLTPLVSLSAAKPDLANTGNTASTGSLAGLFRAVVPRAVVYAAETDQVARTRPARIAYPVFEFLAVASIPVCWPPAFDAVLRLLTRQHYRSQLRC